LDTLTENKNARKIIDTPEPPYYAVIFTSKKAGEDKAYNGNIK